MKNGGEIEKDFIAKRDSYFQDNYVNKTKSNYLRRYRNDLIRSEIKKLEGVKTVLDVGCGPAILYPELLESCDAYYALDLVESNLQKIQAENNTSKIHVIQTDLDNFQSHEHLFDLIICSGSVEYTKNPELIIRTLIDIIKPGGTLIFSFPNWNSPYRIWSEFGFKYLRILKNRILGVEAPNYKRRLFREVSIRRLFEANTNNPNLSIQYFGLKLLPQPLDSILINFDYAILKYFHKHPSKHLLKFAQEFLMVYQCQPDKSVVRQS